MREAELQDRIRLALAQLEGVVLWRNNVGVGYVGQQRTPVRYGLAVGSADLVGLVRTDGGWGRFIALEIKTERGLVTDDQARWLRLVQRLGGYAVVVRSVEEAVAAVEAARRTGRDDRTDQQQVPRQCPTDVGDSVAPHRRAQPRGSAGSDDRPRRVR